MSEPMAPIHRRAGAAAWRDDHCAPWMVTLPMAEFSMGETRGDKFATDTERPAHRVRIDYPLAIGAVPVTVEEFRAFQPKHAPADDPDLPVAGVTWHEAQAYCAWLTMVTGRAYRLPSEAEWEFACRAGSPSPFACGDEITPEDANFLYTEYGQRVGVGARTPVGAYAANAFGLQDLHGNVCEWTEDVWHPNYLGAPTDGSVWIEGGCFSQRVLRGGAWDYLPRLLRSAWRDWLPADQSRDNLGFRIATSEPPSQTWS